MSTDPEHPHPQQPEQPQPEQPQPEQPQPEQPQQEPVPAPSGEEPAPPPAQDAQGPAAAAWGVSRTSAPVSSAGKRFGAWLLEFLLLVVTLFVGWLVWSLIKWSKGQTPAKSLLGMRCVRTDTGRAATWATMALREVVGKWLLGNATFGITTIVSGFMILGESRQGLWDKIASTVVVDDPDGRLVG